MELKVIPVLQVLIAMALMTLLSYYFPALHYSAALSIIVAILLLFIALVIAFFAIYSFKKHKTTVNPTKPETSSEVVNSGIYQYSRNPMYLAMLLALIAYACYLENPLNFTVCGLFIGYITRYQITPEERMLTKLFGQDYRDYKASVRRWL